MKRASTAVALVVCCCAPVRAQDASAGEGVSLSQAVALALSREPATRAASADVEVARGVRLQANARANPTMSVERREEPGGTDAATTASVEWPLELFRRGPRVAVADAQIRVVEHEAAEVRRQLAGEVATAYGEAAAAIRELAIMNEILAAATEQLELLRARAAQGATPTLDRDLVEVDVHRLEAGRLVQIGLTDRVLIRLKRLMGMAPDASLRLAQSLEQLTAVPAAGGAPPPTRPDILASEARVRAEEARLEAARVDGRPDVTVFGSYMRMDMGFPQQAFSPDGDLERVRGRFNYLTAGAMVSIPLWNRQQGTIAAAVAAREGAEARLEAARLTAASEVAEARVRLQQARAAAALYENAVRPLARRNLDTVRETYQLGRATVFDVLAEQRRYLDSERAFTQALSEVLLSRISLSRAMGEVR